MDFTEYDTRLSAYAVIVDAQERVLLALWNELAEGLWTMPGGGVELDETAAAAVVREVREETGYGIELGSLLGLFSFVVPGGHRLDGSPRPLKSVRVVYEARVTSGELTHELDGTTDEARWIPLSDVSELPRVDLVDDAIGMWRSAKTVVWVTDPRR